MIYEARTYRLKPRAVPEFMETFGKAYQKRQTLSKLSGFFYTEIGTLNEVVHIWPYKDQNERDKKKARAIGNKKYAWPPKVKHLIEDMRADVCIPAPFCPVMASGALGPIFEWREYQILPGMMDTVYRNWGKVLEKRLALSPLVMAMHIDAGSLNRFIHIWGYESLEHRAAVRAEAVAKGFWPPRGSRETLKAQQNKILLAAPFSPVR